MSTKLAKGIMARTLAPSTTTERHPVGTVGILESRYEYGLWSLVTKWTRSDGVEKTDRSFYFPEELQPLTL